jgi:Ca2+-binding RTX toxin-like protein
VATIVDFGRVSVGSGVIRSIAVRNVGEGALTVASVSLRTYSFATGEYKIVSDDATGASIPPGGVRHIGVRFTPTKNNSGTPRPTTYFAIPSGLALNSVSYVYDDHGVRIADGIWHYFRNVGGTGSAAYRATASNDTGSGFVISGQKLGTATLRAGEYYAAQAVSPYGGAADETAQDLYLPTGFHSRKVLTPLWPATYVTALKGVSGVTFPRLGDAMLVIDSSDPTRPALPQPYGYASETGSKAYVQLRGEGRAVCPGYAGDARNQIVGTAAANTLTGTARADIICGLGGDDVLIGAGGNDLLLGGWGNDTLRARDDRADVVKGGGGRDVGVVDRVDTCVSVEVRRVG